MKYKYIIIGNGNDWLDKCYEKQEEPYLFSNTGNPIFVKNKILNIFIRFIFSVKHRRWRIRKLFFIFSFFSSHVNKDDNLVFVIYDHNRISLDEDYLSWIRKKYINSKLVYIFTNIVKKSNAYKNNYQYKLNEMYDLIYAFDKKDAATYNYSYHYLVFDPIKKQLEEKEKYDCIFVGKAKDRINKIHDIYLHLKHLGLKTCFYINDVNENDKLSDSDIIYNVKLPYSKVQELTIQSRCIVDIMQDSSNGITLRTCESVVWNKKLITNNHSLVNEEFYTENCLIINNVTDIKFDFFVNSVNLTDKFGYIFSIKKFLNDVEQDLRRVN